MENVRLGASVEPADLARVGQIIEVSESMSPEIKDRIETERRRLQQAAVAALAIAAEEDPEEVDAGDVARAVKAMIEAVTNLDSVSLQRT